MPTARLLTHNRSCLAQEAPLTRRVALVTPILTGAELNVSHLERCAGAGAAIVANAKPTTRACLLSIVTLPAVFRRPNRFKNAAWSTRRIGR